MLSQANISVFKEDEKQEYFGQLNIEPIENSKTKCSYNLVNISDSSKKITGTFEGEHTTLASLINKMYLLINTLPKSH